MDVLLKFAMNSVLRHIVPVLFLILAVEASAQENWKLHVGADFDVYFDNREYASNAFGYSQTLFSSRLTPLVGVGWDDRHRLMLGMDLQSNFGHDVTFEKVRPQVYYKYQSRNRKVDVSFGIFAKKDMIGEYSEAIMSDSTKWYENRIQGLMAQYKGDRGFFEVLIDWVGMYSKDTREKFRIMSSGKYFFDKAKRHFYGGYNFMMYHYAGSEQIVDCVNDNILLEPFIGTQFTAWADFDIRLRYIQGVQRDRSTDIGALTPKGGMFNFRMQKWGVFVDEMLYFGENLQPYYRSSANPDFPYGYGGDLYPGDSFFGTTQNIYSYTKIGYERKFCHDILHVKAFFALQYDGVGLGSKQVVSLSVRFLKDIPLQKNKD